ncbi:MAG: NAD(P)-dependent oxidoreductase [Microbacterium sp.]|uniref:NAD(P)-dependent oxidoreductase n=1 Tax=Microbacterium sp. TaxID=51671 RepID=UPI003F98C434
MRLLLAGVTGGTGKELLAQAVAAGHDVTVVVRSPARLPSDLADSVVVVEGDVLERGAWMDAVAGHDVLLSCLGSTDRKHPTAVYSDGTMSILHAMGTSPNRRAICLSSGGLDIGPDVPFAQRIVTKLIIQRIYRHGYDDMRRMEAVLRAEDLRWTIIRAPMLADGEPTGSYRTAKNSRLKNPTSIRRADLAQYMLAAVADEATWKSVIEISR